MLASEDYGKDLATVQNILKKHQLLEADIAAHEVCHFVCLFKSIFTAVTLFFFS